MTNGTGDGTYAFNEVVTVEADSTGTFSYWEDPDGIVLSTEATYKFSMLEDKTVIAVFDPEVAEADAPRILLSEDLDIRIGYRSYIALFYLPDGYKLIEYGMLTLTEDNPIESINTSGVILNQGFKYFGETNEFVMSHSLQSHYSIRAYLVVEDSDKNLHYYYSERNPQYTHLGPVDLGLAYNFAILSKAGISATAGTHIWGDLGISPAAASYITGFDLVYNTAISDEYSTSALVTGKVYAPDYGTVAAEYLTTAVSNMETAYTDAAGRAPSYTDLHADGKIGGATFAPGVYKYNMTVIIDGDITLDADGDANATWIFQITNDLIQPKETSVILAGGAVAENIVWQVTEEVEIRTDAHFEGTILCATKVALQTGATLNGRILSQTAVTLDEKNQQSSGIALIE